MNESLGRRISRAESFGSWVLWAGVLTGPIAWAVQLVVGYGLEEIACAPAAQERGEIAGVGVEVIIVALGLVLLAATAASGLGALRCLRTAHADDETPGARASWMAIAGVMTSILFVIVIGAGTAPPLLLDVCAPTP